MRTTERDELGAAFGVRASRALVIVANARLSSGDGQAGVQRQCDAFGDVEQATEIGVSCSPRPIEGEMALLERRRIRDRRAIVRQPLRPRPRLCPSRADAGDVDREPGVDERRCRHGAAACADAPADAARITIAIEVDRRAASRGGQCAMGVGRPSDEGKEHLKRWAQISDDAKLSDAKRPTDVNCPPMRPLNPPDVPPADAHAAPPVAAAAPARDRPRPR